MREFNPSVSIIEHVAASPAIAEGYMTRKADIVIWDDVETPVTTTKPTPAIGHTCLIRHQVKRSANGDVLGLQRADGKGQRVPITAVYLDGLVRTGTSDVWQVQPAGLNTWETINPNHGKSE